MNDELLIKFLLNESNSEENDEVNLWLAAEENNKAYLEQLRKIWLESKKLAVSVDIDEEAAWLKFKEKVKSKPVVKLKIWNAKLRIAALLALAISSIALYTIYKRMGYSDIYAQQEVVSQVLPDGSELTLNKFSHLKFANNFTSNRRIDLASGEVFFKVKKDKKRPFVVQINRLAVEVVGTSFNVKYINQQTEIIVESGIVEVRLGNEKIRLYKGEKVSVSKNQLALKKEEVNNTLYSYYRTNLFDADQTPLPILIQALNEAYGAQISVDKSAELLTVTTTLSYKKSLNSHLKLLTETFENLKVRRNGNQIMLSY